MPSGAPFRSAFVGILQLPLGLDVALGRAGVDPNAAQLFTRLSQLSEQATEGLAEPTRGELVAPEQLVPAKPVRRGVFRAGSYLTSTSMCPICASAHPESGPRSTYLVNLRALWSVSTSRGKLEERA